MKETRKQKIDRQRGYAADKAFEPIRAAMDAGDLVITPVGAVDPLSLEFCPQCGSGPRQAQDIDECPDCGRTWEGPPLRNYLDKGSRP